VVLESSQLRVQIVYGKAAEAIFALCHSLGSLRGHGDRKLALGLAYIYERQLEQAADLRLNKRYR
jgi:hypothetical protein